MSGYSRDGILAADESHGEELLRDSAPNSGLALPHPPLCHFTVHYKALGPEEYLLLCGDIPELGCWNPKMGLKLTFQPGGNWVGSVKLPSQGAFEAKVS